MACAAGTRAHSRPAGARYNIIKSRKREHSRKPDEAYELIEACSPGPFLEMFARGSRAGWSTWGQQADAYSPDWPTYAHHSHADSEADGLPAEG